MHPVVLEQIRDALDRRDSRELSRAAGAERMRRERLREGLRKIGVVDGVLADDVLIERIDEWMLANCRGRRDVRAYGAALIHARKEKWL